MAAPNTAVAIAENSEKNDENNSVIVNIDSSSSALQQKCVVVGERVHQFFSGIFPILEWSRTYRREWAFSDLVAGLTLVSLHIPQAIAYARLAGASPINGLYVSIFPPIIYALMGTSRQISIGTFAVVSIACRDILSKFESSNDSVDPMHILCTIAFMVGVIQLIVGVLRLGALKVLLSDALVSAFVAASTLHVLTSQIGTLLGLDESNKLRSGTFALVQTWFQFFRNIQTANVPTVILSGVTLFVLWSVKQHVEPCLSRRLCLKNFIIPIDIICSAVLVGVSHFINLKKTFGIELVSSISSSFVNSPLTIPQWIHLEYVPQLLSSSLVLSLVIYVSSYSLASIFATRHQYKVSANQELLALGAANLVSAFLQCYPCSGSLSRSLVQDRLGAKTQVSSLISVLFVAIFALKFIHLLALLPKCTLASIIVCALIPSLIKINQFRHFWSISHANGTVWIVTFIAVTLVGVETGLLIGLALSTAHFFIDTFSLDKNFQFRHRADGLVLEAHFNGPLYRLNSAHFCKSLHKHLDDLLQTDNRDSRTVKFWLNLENVTLLDSNAITRIGALLAELNSVSLKIDHEIICGSALTHQKVLQQIGLTVRCHVTLADALANSM